MPNMETKFLTIVRRMNTKKSMYAAHRLIDHISTPVLMSSGMELAHRAVYLYNNRKVTQADYSNQLAYQIAGALEARGVNADKLREKAEAGLDLIE